MIPTPLKLPPRPHNNTALTPSSYDITKDSGQEASGDSGGIEMPTRLCSKCPLALRFGFLPENYWLCQRGQFALSQGRLWVSHQARGARKGLRARQRRGVDPFSLSASDVLPYMACHPDCRLSRPSQSKCKPQIRPRFRGALPTQHPTHSHTVRATCGCSQVSFKGKCARITKFPLHADVVSGIFIA